mmetsp:Transcript_10647/g.26474  ORF Transcript_10647/g.26474 Transcript_10647/m.26474 type:complete len:245 (+) Transcript_10647:641-1375(+)
MAWARNELEQLRHRVDEVENLRHEEEEDSLRVVSKDGCDGERHSSEVAVRISDEYLRRVPIMSKQRQRSEEEGHHQVERKKIVIMQRALGPSVQLNSVVENHGRGDHDRLTHLEAVHTGENVDRVGAEDCQRCHENVIQRPESECLPQPWSQELGKHDERASSIHGIHDHEWERGRQRKPQLVSPTEVEHIVRKSKKAHTANRKKGTEEFGEVSVREVVGRAAGATRDYGLRRATPTAAFAGAP